MRIKLQTLFSNTFVQGTVVLTLASGAGNFMNYLFNIILARKLGPSAFGDLAAMISYLAVISVPLSITQTLFIKKISEAGDARVSYAKALETWFFQKIRRWWFIPILATFLTPYFSQITHVSLSASITLVGLILVALIGTFYDSMLQGIRKFGTFSAVSLLSVSIKLLGALFLYTAFGSYGLLLACLLFSNLIRIPISRLTLLHAQTSTKKVFIQKRLMTLFQDQKVFFPALSLLGLTLIGNADIMVVKRLFDGQQAGIYGSWSLLAKIILYAAGSGLSVGLVFFSSSDQQKNYKKVLLYSLAFLTVFAGCAISFYSLFGRWFIEILFGSKFADVIKFLPLAGIFGSGYLLITFLNQYFIAQNRKVMLVAPLIAPFYITALFLHATSLKSVMVVNIVITGFMLILYVLDIAFFHTHEKNTAKK